MHDRYANGDKTINWGKGSKVISNKNIDLMKKVTMIQFVKEFKLYSNS